MTAGIWFLCFNAMFGSSLNVSHLSHKDLFCPLSSWSIISMFFLALQCSLYKSLKILLCSSWRMASSLLLHTCTQLFTCTVIYIYCKTCSHVTEACRSVVVTRNILHFILRDFCGMITPEEVTVVLGILFTLFAWQWNITVQIIRFKLFLSVWWEYQLFRYKHISNKAWCSLQTRAMKTCLWD